MTGLPSSSYERPPLVEVVLGVQFRPLGGLTGFALAPLRELWRSTHPTVQYRPPLAPIAETPGGQRTPAIRVTRDGAEAARYWFLSESGHDLIQVQSDRLIVNWRRQGGSAEYPRYSRMRAQLAQRLHDLSELVTREGLGSVDIDQAELNYINVVGDARGALDQVLKAVEPVPGHHLGAPEQARLSMVYRIDDLGRRPVRLYLGAEPGVDPVSGAPASLLTVTVRGALEPGTLDEALSFMDLAHSHAVRSFSELTTEPMQAMWGLRA